MCSSMPFRPACHGLAQRRHFNSPLHTTNLGISAPLSPFPRLGTIPIIGTLFLLLQM